MAEDLGLWDGRCPGVSTHAYNSHSGLGHFPSEIKSEFNAYVRKSTSGTSASGHKHPYSFVITVSPFRKTSLGHLVPPPSNFNPGSCDRENELYTVR